MIWIIVVIGLVILLLLLKVIKSLNRYKSNKNKKNLLLAAGAIIALISAITFEAFFIVVLEDKYQGKFEYSVELESNSGKFEIVKVPIVINRNIQSSLKIVSGKGEINIIESYYGQCLEINFTGPIKIHASLREPDEITNHTLTMENLTIGDANRTYLPRHLKEYWIYYKPPDTCGNNCSIKFESIYMFSGGRTHHVLEGFLNRDWNIYEFNYREILYI